MDTEMFQDQQSASWRSRTTDGVAPAQKPRRADGSV